MNALRWIGIGLCIMSASPVMGEVVHLKGGESLQGKIVSLDEQSISLESDRGFGVIHIQKADIVMVEFDKVRRDPSGTFGVGYFHRSTANGAGGTVEYGTDALSLKYWIDEVNAAEFQAGFFSSARGSSKKLAVFSMDGRYSRVFKRDANLDLYWGASAGYLSVTDSTQNPPIDGTGRSFRVFLGGEMFFSTLPNLGISAEVGIGSQVVGDYTITNISTTTFPTLSMRYYF